MKSLVKYIKESQLEANGFVILKPGFGQYVDDWKRLICDVNGWDMIRCTKCKLSPEQAADLYFPHKDKDFYDDLCKYMCSDYCYCAICHKDCEDPIKEMDKIKATVRDNWGIDEMKNAMHSSDSLENVDRESKIYLK